MYGRNGNANHGLKFIFLWNYVANDDLKLFYTVVQIYLNPLIQIHSNSFSGQSMMQIII